VSPLANSDTVQIDKNSANNVFDVIGNDEGGQTSTDDAIVFIKDSAGNNVFDLKDAFADYYLYKNGLDGDGTITIDGVVWTISTINTETQSITTTTNNQGYTETVTSDTATQDTISTYTTSMGSNSVKTPGTYSTSLTGPLVIDTSGTFAFNANDTRTLTNVSIAYIDGVIADSGFYWIGGTALLDGEPVTVDFKEIRSLQVTAVGIAENGTVTIVDGEIQYTPNTDFSGMDSFAYTITDSATGEISIATVNVEVALTTEPTAPSNNILVQGSDNNDILTIDSGTSIVQAGDGMDLAIFNDSYDNYTFSQSDSFVPYVTHNVTGQVTSLYGVEHIKFTDGLIDLSNVGDGRFMIDSIMYAELTHPNITTLSNGGFAIAWGGSNPGELWCQVYDVIGNSIGSKIQISPYSAGSTYVDNHGIIALADGGFAVVWNDNPADATDRGLQAKIYENDGSIRTDFAIDTGVDSSHSPNIIELSDKSLIVAWKQDSGVYALHFEASGDAIGSSFKVESYDSEQPANQVSIASLNNGGYVITWTSMGQDFGENSTQGGIYAQRYDANSARVGGEFQVHTTTTGYQSNSSIAALTDGGFVVAWQSDDNSIGQSNIIAQRFNEDGIAIGSELQVNSNIVDTSHQYAHIKATDDGGFIITWQADAQVGGYDDIYVKRFDADGEVVGSEIKLATGNQESQYMPSISILDDGGFVVAWSSEDSTLTDIPQALYAQRFDSEGNLLGVVAGYTDTVSFDLTPDNLIDTSSYYTHQVVGGDFAVWRDYIDSGQTSYVWYGQKINHEGYVGEKFQLPIGDVDYMNVEFNTIDLPSGQGIIVTDYDYEQGNEAWVFIFNENGNPISITDINEVTGINGDDILTGVSYADYVSTLEGVDAVETMAGSDLISLTADGIWGSGYVAYNMSNINSIGTGERVSIEGLIRFTDVIDAGVDVDVLELTDGSDAFFIDDVYSPLHSSLTLSSTAQGINSTARVVDLEYILAGDGNVN